LLALTGTAKQIEVMVLFTWIPLLMNSLKPFVLSRIFARRPKGVGKKQDDSAV